jgi:hypothetical protein
VKVSRKSSKVGKTLCVPDLSAARFRSDNLSTEPAFRRLDRIAMVWSLQDLPQELILHILEAGCEHDNDPSTELRHQWFQVPDADRNYLVFNERSSKRLKRFCWSLIGASRFWLELINRTPWCWVLEVSLPGIIFPFKYDISMEIAHLKTNLNASSGCDIMVTCNQRQRDWAIFIPGTHHTMSMLMLHALRLLRPHAHRIIYLDISMWDAAGLSTALAILASFGPLSRLRKILTRDDGLDWDSPVGFGQTTATPFTSVLDFPLNPAEVNWRDVSFFTNATSYATSFVSAESRIPPNLTSLSVSIWSMSLMTEVTCQALEVVLSQCPGLEILEIVFPRTPRDASFGILPASRVLLLKHLRRLQLSIPNSTVAWAILLRCNLPSLQRLQIFSVGMDRPDPPDSFAPRGQIAPLLLPSLKYMVVDNFPPGLVTPLHYVKVTEPLEDVSYHIGSPHGLEIPVPTQSMIASNLTNSITLSVEPSKDPYVSMISLLVQHDLSQTSVISITGTTMDSGYVPFQFLPKCVETWMRSPDGAFHALSTRVMPPLRVPQLRSMVLGDLICFHVVDYFLGIFVPGDGFESITLHGIRGCQSHGDTNLGENFSQCESRKKRFSGITSLSVDAQSLAPCQDLALNPFWLFCNLSTLTILLPCHYNNQCPYEGGSIDVCMRYLDHGDALANLNLLCWLTVGITRRHFDTTPDMPYRDHENLKRTVREILKTIRRVTALRQGLGLTPIREVYLEVDAWASRSPGSVTRLR